MKDEHDTKTVRYVKRNWDGVWGAIALGLCVAVVAAVAYVFVKFGVE